MACWVVLTLHQQLLDATSECVLNVYTNQLRLPGDLLLCRAYRSMLW